MNPLFKNDWRDLGAIQFPKAAAKQLPQKQKGKGGFATSLISEGGALGGAALGASLGSVVPVVGTAIGGIIGAGLGAYTGRLAENKIRDDDWRMGEAAKEGAISAALAGPLKLGKYAATAGKAGLAGKGLTAALTEGADDAAKFTLKGTIGNKLVGKADDLAIKGFKFTPSQLTKFNKRWGEDATKVISRNGLASGSIDDFAEAIAKQQGRFDELVETAGTIKKTDLESGLRSVQKTLTSAAPSQTKQLGKSVQGEVDELLKGFGDEISATELNQIRRQYDDLVNYAAQVSDPAKYGVNKRLADTLRKTIQKASGSDELKTAGTEISKLRQLSDSVAMQSNRGRGANPLGLTTLLAGGVGASAGGLPGAIGAGVASKVANSPTSIKLAGNAVRGAGERLIGKAAGPGAIRSAVTGAARGQVAEGLAGALTQSQPLNAPMMPMTDPMSMQNSNSMVNQSSAFPDDSASTSPVENPYTRENLLADIQRDPKNAKDYMEYYAMLDEVFNPKGEEPKALTQGQQERSDLIGALDLTEQAVDQGSINYGPIGSRVEGFKSMFNAADPETLSFKQTVSGLRAAITKARAGSSLTAGELKMLEKYTPSETDSEQVVRSKLQQLRALYGNQAPQGGGSSLEELLMQQQGAF